VLRNKSPLLQPVLKLFGLFVLCCGATFINPYGYDLHSSILSLGRSDYFMNYHNEWLSPDIFTADGGAVVCFRGFIYYFPYFRKKTLPIACV